MHCTGRLVPHAHIIDYTDESGPQSYYRVYSPTHSVPRRPPPGVLLVSTLTDGLPCAVCPVLWLAWFLAVSRDWPTIRRLAKITAIFLAPVHSTQRSKTVWGKISTGDRHTMTLTAFSQSQSSINKCSSTSTADRDLSRAYMWNKIISAAETVLKLFRRQWTCWKIFTSGAHPLKYFWNNSISRVTAALSCSSGKTLHSHTRLLQRRTARVIICVNPLKPSVIHTLTLRSVQCHTGLTYHF